MYCERISLRIRNKSCNKGLKCCKFMRKRIENILLKKIILKGNITTKHIEHKLKNTGTCLVVSPDSIVLIHPRMLKSSIKTFFWTFNRNIKSTFIVSFVLIYYVIKFSPTSF